MELKRIFLTEEENGAFVDAYISEAAPKFTRKAILIVPGGSYVHISPRESEPVAHAFLPYGYNAFVLHYTCGKESGKPFPAHLIEATLAIRHIKENAEEYGIDPDELFVIGFSAGGHLAASTGILWKMPEVLEAAGVPLGYARPKGIMLMYPMISSDYSNCQKYTNAFGTLWCCDEPTPEQLYAASVEKHVDADSSPAFIMHTFNDAIVDVRNMMALGAAYADAGVPFEMHIFPDGPHGLSVANGITAQGRPNYINPAFGEWVRLCTAWAEKV